MSDDPDRNIGGNRKPIAIRPGQATARSLPRRFYNSVEVGAAGTDGACTILLDGRTARTPGKRELRLAPRVLAEAVAAEWDAQRDTIDPATMPLTRLINTAIDGVAARMADVAADVVKYAGSDLLCYRADYPEGLAARQRALWDPVLQWVEERHGAAFETATGLMPVAQPVAASQRIAEAVRPLDALSLTALHVMTTLTGSALLSLAVLKGRLTPEAAWEAAHVDEDWQIAEWGEDAEAKARRERRWSEMQAASALLRLAAA
ncbi:MAG: ATP12 family protein [Hyphomicrobiaceae bacterium]